MSSGSNSFWWSETDQSSTKYKVNTNVLITAIFCLVFVVVIVLLLHVYAQFIRRRHRRRLRATAFTHLRTGLSPVQPQAQTQKVGLDPSVIATIQTVVYKETTASASPDCAVCLSTVEEGETVRILPNCKHTFHLECIDIWLQSHSTCPICRAEAAPAQLVDPSGGVASERRGSCREESSTSRLNSSFRWMLNRERSTGDLESNNR